MKYNKFWIGAVLVGAVGLGFLAGRSTAHSVDNLAGRAAFRIERQGDDIYMQPMVAPSFKLAWLKGPKPVESETVQCSVWGREIGQDNSTMTKTTVIVLRCGETEYGISEVDFVFDGVGKKVTQ